jgi:hypothetical protein
MSELFRLPCRCWRAPRLFQRSWFSCRLFDFSRVTEKATLIVRESACSWEKLLTIGGYLLLVDNGLRIIAAIHEIREVHARDRHLAR